MKVGPLQLKPSVGQHVGGREPVNALAARASAAILGRHPDWAPHVGTRGDGDLELAVPAPEGSDAGHLVVFTDAGEHLWVRFAPPSMCYAVDDEAELLWVVDQLVADAAVFVSTWRGAEWTGTTLIAPGQEPELEPGEDAHIVSWSGAYDRRVNQAEDEALR